MKGKTLIGIVLAISAILLVPWGAMQFTNEVNWSVGDFVVAGALLLGTGLTYKLVAGKVEPCAYRVAVGLALGSALLLIWINLAVGLIGHEDDPANLLYAGVLAVGLSGAGMARLQPRGMAGAMAATALAVGLVPIMTHLIWNTALTPTVWVAHLCFVGLFAGSALLFRQAARPSSKPNTGSKA